MFVETKIEDNVARHILGLVVVIGNGRKSLNMSTLVSNSAWIIDSSATDHMTFDSRQVSSLKLSSQKKIPLPMALWPHLLEKDPYLSLILWI